MDKILSDEKRQEIADKLQSKGLRMVCPMCTNNQFTVVDGFISNALQSGLQGVSLGGPSLPTCAIVCNRCGFLSQHALGALDLL